MEVTYAIGDVHGRLDLLERALAWIDEDAGDDPAHVVFVGDYVDRGPDSYGVVRRLMDGPREPGHRWTCLMGNHEDMLVASTVSDEAVRVWWGNGGSETLSSYQRAADETGVNGIPREHVEWMSSLPVMLVERGRVFVHAMYDVTLKPSEQRRAVMLWGRAPAGSYAAVSARDEDGASLFVVHGHTPMFRQLGPAYVPSRVINLDTGACYGGSLSVAVWRVASFGESDLVLEADSSGRWRVV